MTTKSIEKKKDGALAMPSAPAGFGKVAGTDSEDLSISVLSLFHGSKDELKGHGDLGAGNWYFKDTSSVCEDIDDQVFVVIKGFKTWVKYGKTHTDPIVYKKYNKKDVPPEDLEWRKDVDGDPIPPIATAHWNFFVLFDGMPIPVMLQFKKTSYDTGTGLNKLEFLRQGQAEEENREYVPGVYRIYSTEGKKCLIPKCQPKGDVTPEHYTRALKWFGVLPDHTEIEIKGEGDDGLPI